MNGKELEEEEDGEGVLGGLFEGPNKPKVGFGKRESNGRCGSGRRANTNVGVMTFAHLFSMSGTPTAIQW